MHGQFPLNIKQASNSADSPVEFSWVSSNLAQFWHYQQRASDPTDYPSLANCKSMDFTCANCYKSGFPQLPPSLHLINLLEWLPELRETLYLHLPVSYKGYFKGHICQCMQEKVVELPCLLQYPTSSQLPMFNPPDSLNPVLIGFYGGLITQAGLNKSLAIGDQFNLQYLSPF